MIVYVSFLHLGLYFFRYVLLQQVSVYICMCQERSVLIQLLPSWSACTWDALGEVQLAFC